MGIDDEPLRGLARLSAQRVPAEADDGRQAFGERGHKPLMDTAQQFFRAFPRLRKNTSSLT